MLGQTIVDLVCSTLFCRHAHQYHRVDNNLNIAVWLSKPNTETHKKIYHGSTVCPVISPHVCAANIGATHNGGRLMDRRAAELYQMYIGAHTYHVTVTICTDSSETEPLTFDCR